MTWVADPSGAERPMRIISKSRLRAFWEVAGHEDARGPLLAWHTHVSHRSVAWRSWADVKAEFGSASLVGNCTVFNIGGNKYRLATRILYPSQKIFILKVMTHAEYDRDQWKEDCGCYQSPPPKRAKPASPSKGRKKRDRR
jgi:mRNA interferase HigB